MDKYKPTYNELELKIQKLEAEISKKDSKLEIINEVEKLANIGHWSWDITDSKLSWSDEIFNIFGVSKDKFEVSTENFEKTIHPDDLQTFLTEREKALSSDTKLSITHRIIKPNNEIRFVEEHAIILRNCKGIAKQVLGTVQDITEEKLAEKRIIYQASLLEQVDRSVVTFDFNNIILSWNKHSERLFQWKSSEVIGENIVELLTPQELRKEANANFEKLNKEGHWEGEFEVVKKDGKAIPVYIVNTYLKDENSNNIGFLGVATDISKRKHFEQELNEKNDKLKKAKERAEENEKLLIKVAENYPNSYISIIEKDLTIGFSGGQEFIRQNLNPNDFIGLTLKQVFGDQEPIVKKNYLETFKGKETSFELFINNQYQLYNTVPLFIENNRVSKILVVVENISEQKNRENLLNQYKRIVDSSTDMMAIFDVNYTYIATNKAYLDAFDLKHHQLIGKTLKDVFGEEFFNTIIKEKVDLCMKGKDVSYHDWFIFPAHGKRYMEISYYPYYLEDKVIMGFVENGRNLSERKKVEQALKESEEKLKYVLENSISTAYNFNFQNGYYDYISLSSMNIFGYSQVELNSGGMEFVLNKIHKEDRTRIGFYFNKLLNGEIDYLDATVEYRFKHPEKGYRWISDTRTVIYDDNNNPISLIGNLIDITEKKLTQNKLLESEQKYRLLFDKMNSGFALHKIITNKDNEPIDYTFIEVNSEFEKQTGLVSSAIINKKVTNVLPGIENDPVNWIKKYGKVALSGEENKFEHFSQNLQRWYNVTVYSPMPNYFATIFRDITKNKLAIHNTIRQKILFETMFKAISDAVVITNVEREITHVNNAFTKIFGYTKEFSIGKTTALFYAKGENYEEAGKKYFNMDAPNKKGAIYIQYYKTKEGRVFPGETFGAKLFDESRECIGLIGIVRDVTDRIQTQKNILNATIQAEEKERERIAREIHDGVSPMLSAIKNYAQSLGKFQNKEVLKELQKQLESTVTGTVECLSEISNNLSPHVLRNFGLNAAIQNFINKISDLKEIKLKLNCTSNQRFDINIETAIFRVTTELINNTLKYSNANSITINIDLRKSIDYEYFENGEGFDFENIIRHSKGMGLKNIISRVEALNGEFNIKSSNGVKVHISIPLN